jgi:hypothetical protein
MNSQKLKLGILLDSYNVPAWVYRSLERMVNSEYAEFSLVILNGTSPQSGNGNVIKNPTSFVYRVFNIVDERVFLREHNALELRNIEVLLSGASVIKMTPNKSRSANYFDASDIKQILGYNLDILIQIGFEELQGEILTAAKYGVWLYRFDGNPHGFWEVVEDQTETRIALQISGGGTYDGKVLYSSSSATYSISPARNRNRSLWLGSSFLSRQIALLNRLGQDEFFAEIKRYEDANLIPRQQNKKAPSNLLSLWLIFKLLIKISLELFSRVSYLGIWFLLIDVNADDSLSFENYKKILPPKDLFWADPFVVQKNDKNYVFVEEYPFKTKRGHLAVIEVDQKGNYSEPVRILEKQYHLSYPCVFEWQDKYYMVPETAENRTIDLYECLEFPGKWEYQMTLMENIKAVDTTIVFFRGKWWLFTGVSENDGAFPEVELFLFYADDLFTKEWKPHPKNPIVSDVKRARPAGRIFTKNGKLYRPSQDCSKSYGYGFDLNEILNLSETDYEEKKVASVRPWNNKIRGTHTFGTEGNFVVIDAYTKRLKFF